MLLTSVCPGFKETRIYWSLPYGKRHKAVTAGRGLRDLGGKQREVVVLHLAKVWKSFPADTNPDSSSGAPPSAFAKSWKGMACDCLRPDPLRVTLKGRMYSVQLQTVEHSIFISESQINGLTVGIKNKWLDWRYPALRLMGRQLGSALTWRDGLQDLTLELD